MFDELVSCQVFQRYRLFFRNHAMSKMIVCAWANDEDSKRAYESNDDTCQRVPLNAGNGHPPEDWSQLLTEAPAEGQRLQPLATGITP